MSAEPSPRPGIWEAVADGAAFCLALDSGFAGVGRTDDGLWFPFVIPDGGHLREGEPRATLEEAQRWAEGELG